MPRGKKLGGSSQLNYMVWNRGATSEYDRWASFAGCDGWSFSDVEPALKALERVTFSTDGAYFNMINRINRMLNIKMLRISFYYLIILLLTA